MPGKNHGQAMTEFIIAAPILILLFAGMVQFFIIAQYQLKLSSLERELMMFNSTTTTSKLHKIQAFAAEYAAAIGLDPANVSVNNQSLQDKMPNSNFAFTAIKWVLDFFPGITNALYGRDIYITYTVPLMAPFKFFTPSGNLTLKAWIHSGVGDVWNIDMNPVHILNKVLDTVLRGARWLINIMTKFFKGKW